MRTRAENEAEARRLRAEGLYLREIAERMGVRTSTVHAWLADPGGLKLRARKDSYRGTCEVCGGLTDGSNGPDNAPTLCIACRTWTRESVLVAFDEWSAAHDGRSPRIPRTAEDKLPHERSVARLFGSWNAALIAGGYRLSCDRRPETAEAILHAVRSGEATIDIAARFGVTPEAIHERMKVRGTSVREQRALGAAEGQVAA